MRATECTTAENAAENAARLPFLAGLQRIPDPRQRRGQRYAWETLLLVICAALVSGQQTGAAIAQWIVEHAVEWQAWAPTTAGRVPSAATTRRGLRLVDVGQLDQALGNWIEARLGGDARRHPHPARNRRADPTPGATN